jgi:Uma2 family endonuclease
MATVSRPDVKGNPDYPTSDGKPMAETQIHWEIMVDLTQVLQDRYADNPKVYVASDLMLCYQEGDKKKHVARDVFGVDKEPMRLNYIVWEEGKAPDVIIEVTSKTRKNEQTLEHELYRDVLKVGEYFLFDPKQEYLRPSLQGYRLVAGEYVPIEPTGSRLASELLRVELERVGEDLRLFGSETGRVLRTRRERAEQTDQALGEIERLRAEVEELRRRLAGGAGA